MKKAKTPKTQTVICQLWYESDSWSGITKDGYSLHLTEEKRKEYIKTHNESLPKHTPEVYTFAGDTHYQVDVGADVMKQLKNVVGLRYFGDPPSRTII